MADFHWPQSANNAWTDKNLVDAPATRLSSSVPASPDKPVIKWVFLDRDGTLNAKPPDGEYIERPEMLELLPGAGEAVSMLNHAGLWTGVVTNQRGIALGRMSMGDVDAIHERLRQLLHQEDAVVDALYTCPHQMGACDCRKPQPGMLLRAQAEHPGLDFGRSAIVGDSVSDIRAGRCLGLTTVLVTKGEYVPAGTCSADHVVPDLLHAAEILVEKNILVE